MLNEEKKKKEVTQKSILPPRRQKTSAIRQKKKYQRRSTDLKFKSGEEHHMFGKRLDPLWSRKVAIGNFRNCLETNARGFVHTSANKYLVRMQVGGKRYSLGSYTSPHTAHRVYVFAVQERIAELAKEIAYLEKYPIEQLRKLGKLPMKRPKDGVELLDQVDLMFTQGIAMSDYR